MRRWPTYATAPAGSGMRRDRADDHHPDATGLDDGRIAAMAFPPCIRIADVPEPGQGIENASTGHFRSSNGHLATRSKEEFPTKRGSDTL